MTGKAHAKQSAPYFAGAREQGRTKLKGLYGSTAVVPFPVTPSKAGMQEMR